MDNEARISRIIAAAKILPESLARDTIRTLIRQ